MATLFDQLDDEWRALATDPALADRHRPILRLAANATDWAQAQQWMRDPRTASSAKDALLIALVERSVHGDTTAARIMLALLTPGMVTELSRHRRRPTALRTSLDEDELEVAGLAWTLIRGYPIDRRPNRIAANIILDIRKHLHRRTHAQHSLVELGDVDPEDPSAGIGAVDEPDLRALIDHAVRASSLDHRSAALIIASRVEGHRLEDLARTENVSARTLRRRRHRAERILADHARRALAA